MNIDDDTQKERIIIPSFGVLRMFLWVNPMISRFCDESYVVPIDKDPLVVPDGPITRLRAKKIKEAMDGLVQST